MAVIPFELEVIYTNQVAEVNRAKVPGGWLVILSVHSHREAHVTTTFVADAEWSWELE